MSEMVERVAKALEANFEEESDDWEDWVPLARAAIEALREPTEEMMKAKKNATIGLSWPGTPGEMEHLVNTAEWQAIIDAALEKP